MKPASIAFFRTRRHAMLFALALLPAPGAALGQVPQADLSISKTVSNATPNVGDTVTFTVTVTNGGPQDATNVAASDALPAGLTFVSALPSQGTYTAATGIWSIGSIANLGSQTLQISATVVSPNMLTNTATITAADQADPNASNNTASASVTPQQADLALAKSVDNPTPNVGDTITFTVTLGNNGPNPATNVVATDLLPAGLTFISATPSQGTYAAAGGNWTVGTVLTGTPQTLVLQARVTSPIAQTNTATISHSDQFDPNAANNTASATVTPEQADLAVAKSVSDATPTIGSTVTFTITVTNNGPGAATGVALSDLLPAGLTLVSAIPSQGTYDGATGTWTVGTLGATTSQTLQLQVLVAGSTPQTNTATIAHSDEFDPDTANNTASATVTPQQGGGPPPTAATPTPIDARWMLMLIALLLATIGISFTRHRG